MGQKIGGSEKMKRSRVGGGSKGRVTSENWGGTPYDGLYGGRLRPNAASGIQVYGRVGMSVVEVYKSVGKSVIWVCKRAQKV